MTNEKVFAMSFAKVYPMLIAKIDERTIGCYNEIRARHFGSRKGADLWSGETQNRKF